MARTTGNDELYRLIQSLTPEEKGYFKKFSGRHTSEDSQYLKIFDIISQQKKFDETELKKKFRNYVVMKVYLFEMVMQSLMIYQREGDGKFNPHYSMIYFHILFRKGLWDKADQLARKTLEWVAEVEWFPMHVQFLELKLLMDEKKWTLAERSERRAEIFREVEVVRRKEQNRDKYSEISYIIYEEELRIANSSSYKSNIDKLVDIRFLKEKKNSLSVTSDRMRFVALAKYYRIKHDRNELYKILADHYRFEASFVGNRLKTHSQYLSLSLRAQLENYLENGDADKAKKLFDQEWRLDKNTPHTYYNSIHTIQYDTYENYLYYCQLHSFIYWHTKSYKEGYELIVKEQEKLMDEKRGAKNTVAYYDVWKCKVLYEYSLGKMQEAMLSISEMEQMEIKKVMPGIYKDCQWMKVLIQLRLKNHTVLRSLCNSLTNGKIALQFSKEETDVLLQLKKVNMVNEKDVRVNIQKAAAQAEIKIFSMLPLQEGIGMNRK